jgi:signal transduction histidine kinase
MNTRSPRRFQFTSRPHFWLISLLVISLTVMYYYARFNLFDINAIWFKDLIFFEYSNNLNGCLFFIPFVYAAIVFWWRGALIVILTSFAVMLPYVKYMAYNNGAFVRNEIYAFIPILIVGLFAFEFKLREKDKKMAAEREAERHSIVSQIFKAQENERQRIAQELHDDSLQVLYVIADRAKILISDPNSENSDQIKVKSEWIRDSILKVAEDIRRISVDLRPSILDDLSLVPAIRWLIDRMNQDQSTLIQMQVQGVEQKIRPVADVMIFRIIQEALNNAKKHSEASNIRLELIFTQDNCTIIVQDDGKGFLLPANHSYLVSKGKLGLLGIQERAKYLGGTVEINSEPGKGTNMRIEVKLDSTLIPG